MNRNLTPRQWEQISAALDGKLDPVERDQLESALRSDQNLKEAMDEMGALLAFLHSVPQRKAPRSFMLKPDQVKNHRSRTWLPIFRTVSVAASLLMAALLAVEFLPGMLAPKLAAAPAASDMVMMESAAAAEPTAAPMILWNGYMNGQAYGLGSGAGVGGGSGGGDGSAQSVYVEPPMMVTPYPAAKAEIYPPENAVEEAPVMESTSEPTASESERTAEPTPESTAGESAPVGNPILGIRPTQEWGKEVGGTAYEEPLREAPTALHLPWMRIAEIGLGVVALAAALIVFFTRRRR